MTNSAVGKKRSRWALWFRVALAVTILIALGAMVDRDRLLFLVQSASVVLLLAAFLVLLASNLLVTYRWQLLLSGADLNVPFIRLLKLYLGGSLVAFFVPTAVSADIYKGVALNRDLKAANKVASSIVLEKLLALISIVTISMVATGAMPTTLAGYGVFPALLAAAVITASSLLLFLHADRLAGMLLLLIPNRLITIGRFLEELALSFAIYRNRQRLLVTSFLLSTIIQFARCLSVFLVARALNDHTALLFFLLFIPCIYMLNMVPFIGSRIGLEQGAFVVFFGTVGMNSEVALATSFLSVFMSLLLILPGSLWIISGR